MLEDIAGREVKGYRAPSFSIGPANLWAFDCIAEAGYRYSSSVYPIRHDHYGVPDAPRFAHEVREDLLEVPVTTVRMFSRTGRRAAAAISGCCRIACRAGRSAASTPSTGSRRCSISTRGRSIPTQPRVNGLGAKARFRHYLNLDRMEPRLRRLLADFRWDRVDRVFLNGGT